MNINGSCNPPSCGERRKNAVRENYNDATLLEELRYWGTPLDQEVVEKARAARQELKITQTGTCAENVIYTTPSGVEIMASVAITNNSTEAKKLKVARLSAPWLDADFEWLKKPCLKELRKWGGYVLPAVGPCGFDLNEVLNHKFDCGFELQPGQQIEGLLLGAGRSSLPNDYCNREAVPLQLVVSIRRGQTFGAWLKPVVSRETRRTIRDSRSAGVAQTPQPEKGVRER